MFERVVLSKKEIKVADLLWEMVPASVRQIHEALSTERQMDLATDQTYLRRLETKGDAKSTVQGRVRIEVMRCVRVATFYVDQEKSSMVKQRECYWAGGSTQGNKQIH